MKTITELKQQLIAVQKLCRRGVHDTTPVDKKAVIPLRTLKRDLAEHLAANPSAPDALRAMYFVECYQLNFKTALDYLTKVAEHTGNRKDKLDLFALRELVAKQGELALTPGEQTALCANLETALNSSPCDHTLKNTKRWLAENIDRKKHAKIINGLRNNGGYCDCEVLSNAL